MSITIKRNTGWIGMGTRAKIILNGEKVAKVAENSQVDVILPDDKAYLKIRHSGVKSNEIEVKDGDIIEIKKNKWYKWSYPLFMIFMFLSILIPAGLTNKIIFIIAIGALYIMSLYIIEGFYLKVMDKK